MSELILQTDIENANFYLATLAIGVLESFKTKNIPLELGIWTLARPVFWKNLQDNSSISKELVEIISSFDELEAIEELSGKDTLSITINELLSKLYLIQQSSLDDKYGYVIQSNIN